MFEIGLIIRIKMNLALNNQQRLICHKTQTTNQSDSNGYVQDNRCGWVLPIYRNEVGVSNSPNQLGVILKLEMFYKKYEYIVQK